MDVAGVGATDKTRPEPIVSLNGVHKRSPTTDPRAPSIVNQPYQRPADRTRPAGPQESLERACSTSLNRLMRTRMSGGVGRVSGNGGPQPISPLLFPRPDDPDWSDGPSSHHEGHEEHDGIREQNA